jgi:hypothetical protein
MWPYKQICREHLKKADFLCISSLFISLRGKGRKTRDVSEAEWTFLTVLALILSSIQVMSLVISKLTELCAEFTFPLYGFIKNSLTTWHWNNRIIIIFMERALAKLERTYISVKIRFEWRYISQIAVVLKNVPSHFHFLLFREDVEPTIA